MAEKTSTSDFSTCIATDQTAPGTTIKRSEAQTEEPPDGGLRAWATVAGGFMRLPRHLFGRPPHSRSSDPPVDFYVREFMTNKTPSEIAWIGSCQIALQFILGLPVGKAFDAGYFHHLMITGSLIYCVALWTLSLATPNQYYLVPKLTPLGLGIGLGLTFLPALGIAAHHFSRRRGLALGIITSGASIGGIVFPFLLNRLLFSHGFAAGVRATAALITGLLLLANLLMRPRYPKTRAGAPALHRVLTDVPYMVFVLAGLVIMLALFYPIFYLQLYAIKRGVREQLAFDTVRLPLNTGGVVGRLLPPLLADSVGSFAVIIPTTFLAAACVLSMLATAAAARGVVAIALVYGALNAAFVSLTPALLAELSANRGEVGLRMGVWFSVNAVAALAGQPLSGALIQGDFKWSTVFAGACLFAGGCILVFSWFLRGEGRRGGGGRV
ncbi:major facilitator superfamily domain-containing protein [Mycena rosella]|uniref:Major facilitator superfamily domain-containing protein n=1 Tax=Mycena rosella TaxID=1033263 RepID=A0AAD7FVH6_MYCRO|nr:major facilitator superfamily domain-containing protein [Mycena rosella]